MDKDEYNELLWRVNYVLMDRDEYHDLLWRVNYVFFVAASSLVFNFIMFVLYMTKLQGGE